MTDQQTLDRLLPLATAWAIEQEAFILERGAPLNARQLTDAARVGIENVGRVRILVVDRIPLPDNQELAEAARRAQIITDSSQAVTIGHGIIVRGDRWQDRELLLHQLAHIAQCERAGGLESFVAQYLSDRSTCADFSVGSLEEEARRMAREICAANSGAQ